MNEDGRLSYLGLFKLVCSSTEHDIGNGITQYLIGLIKQAFYFRVCIIDLFTHAGKLCSLSGKYISLHLNELRPEFNQEILISTLVWESCIRPSFQTSDSGFGKSSYKLRYE